MDWLISATLVYAGILVLALAASLIAIWNYLWRLGTRLQHLSAVMSKIARETAPLHSRFEPVAEGLSGSAERLSGAQKRLQVAVERLESKSGVEVVK